MSIQIHYLAQVQSKKIGKGTTIWQFAVVLEQAVIGENCNINAHVFIENDVVIGNNVTVKCGVQLWDRLRVEDNVFIGPNVTFVNDRVPRSKNKNVIFQQTLLCKGASVGAGSTILGGIIIGRHALVGAGSVVTKNVGKNEVWFGNPARHVGYITRKGVLLDRELKEKSSGVQYSWLKNRLVRETASRE
jgi:acetyltransferase-like isoleucine patch superfamily enzyme